MPVFVVSSSLFVLVVVDVERHVIVLPFSLTGAPLCRKAFPIFLLLALVGQLLQDLAVTWVAALVVGLLP